jgi:hypothetical protein
MAASHATASLDQLDVAFAAGPFHGILGGGDCIHDMDVLGCGSTGSGVWLFCRDCLTWVVGAPARRPRPSVRGARWAAPRPAVSRQLSSEPGRQKLRWCTERCRTVVEFWLALANAAIISGRLIRRAWTCYRCGGRRATDLTS